MATVGLPVEVSALHEVLTLNFYFVLDHLPRAFFPLLYLNIRTFSYVKGTVFVSVF